MRRYEGLFILNVSGQEDSVGEVIDRLSKELEELGGKIETVQKRDRRSFARVANKKYTAGFYVNFLFTAEPEVARKLQTHFKMDDEVFRLVVGLAPAEEVEQPAAEPA